MSSRADGRSNDPYVLLIATISCTQHLSYSSLRLLIYFLMTRCRGTNIIPVLCPCLRGRSETSSSLSFGLNPFIRPNISWPVLFGISRWIFHSVKLIQLSNQMLFDSQLSNQMLFWFPIIHSLFDACRICKIKHMNVFFWWLEYS